jgi:hypothetical protein
MNIHVTGCGLRVASYSFILNFEYLNPQPATRNSELGIRNPQH